MGGEVLSICYDGYETAINKMQEDRTSEETMSFIVNSINWSWFSHHKKIKAKKEETLNRVSNKEYPFIGIKSKDESDDYTLDYYNWLYPKIKNVLTERQLCVFNLTVFEGLSAETISKPLEVSPQRVTSIFKKSMKIIDKHLKKDIEGFLA